MATRRHFLAGGAAALAALAAAVRLPARAAAAASGSSPAPAAAGFAVTHSDAEWRRLLTTEQYAVLREEGTERPYSSPLNGEHRAGLFSCAGCGLDLFSSRTKFDSHTGWPSFWAPLEHAVGTRTDSTFGMIRTEVHCQRCGGHLGHVFDDGPRPTGLRYCMNGVAMRFRTAAV
ncbi:peptide-methionine (R)-S-oxide reductase [Cupriavidus sp. USMAA2-4]|uniref:peptide-methionine (R)-S-oxide reductase n=1 Tax=Cupriavidus malaysiensis TaxID=367825 RepID=A0ABM6F3P2_9BURK|nr:MULTISPECIES: peptide-methionine (R)-S-oxide reductase MsrB [Cupriavidus]AOY91008.1 peptide-methionine (R)-S-oxide reductase [Cupriavidus sp. USMAA2-4]AOZ06036.1 peptide-methionine (R)-S-oxide reductase [Cupriavidus malaysiensis]